MIIHAIYFCSRELKPKCYVAACYMFINQGINAFDKPESLYPYFLFVQGGHEYNKENEKDTQIYNK